MTSPKDLANQGRALEDEGKTPEAFAIWNQLYEQGCKEGDEESIAIYAHATYKRGTYLSRLERYEEALTTFDTAIPTLSPLIFSDTCKQQYLCCVNGKSILLGDLEQYQEAVKFIDGSIAPCLDSKSPDVRSMLASVLNMRGLHIMALRHFDEAAQAWRELVDLLGDDESLEIQHEVADALLHIGMVSDRLRREPRNVIHFNFSGGVLTALGQRVVNRIFGEDSFKEMTARYNQSIEVHKEIVERYSQSDDLKLHIHVAESLLNIGALLSRRRGKQHKKYYQAVIDRYAGTSHTELEALVQRARERL